MIDKYPAILNPLNIAQSKIVFLRKIVAFWAISDIGSIIVVKTRVFDL